MACALLGVVSCESMLEIPQKGVVSYDSFYASDDDALAALTSMYARFTSEVAGTEGIDNPEQVMLNYSADDILASGGNYADHDGFRGFCEFSYDNANGTLKSAYNRYMTVVYHANLVISNFTNENKLKADPKHTSAFTEQAVAEARVMRAYLHMMLALSWNRPPIVDRLQEGDDLPVNAESQEQVLQWVIDECEKAISSGKLPVRKGTGDKDATARMTVGFAQFVAGKAAMFKNDPATARKYLGALIESGNYALVPSEEFWTNFHRAGDGNSEKIFEPNFLEDPDFTNNPWGSGAQWRGRWMVANVFCWRTDHLASMPLVHNGISGWNGGAIQETFAKKFLEHDGDSPRRRACFLTADEWLYEMDWPSDFDQETGAPLNLTLAQKKADKGRGINSSEGLFSHGPYFEWKHMVYINPPKILTGGKSYPADNIPAMGPASNQKNFNVARYAEALLLYAEACIGSPDAKKGLDALNQVEKRSGADAPLSTELTLANVMEEKQYEMWFENCRFHDLVRWAAQGHVNLDDVFNKSNIHTKVPTAFDALFTKGEAEHRVYTEYSSVPGHHEFVVGKNEYFPFPRDYMVVNPNLKNVLGWEGVE